MSKRKRYRRLRNQQIQKVHAKVSAQRQQEKAKSADEERQKQAQRAAFLYATFVEELASEKRNGPQIIASIEAFRTAIKKKIHDLDLRHKMLNLINEMEIKFLNDHGPKSEAEIELWRQEALTTQPPVTPPNDSPEPNLPENPNPSLN